MMLFGDVSLVTCLPGFTLSSGVKCDADEKFFLGGLSQCVHHEEAVCLLKCPKHHVLQKRCFSRKYHIHMRRENTSSVDPSLKLTSCVSQILWWTSSCSFRLSFRVCSGVWAVCHVFLKSWLHHKSERRAIGNFSAIVQRERFRAQCACVFQSCHVQQARIWKC